MYDSLYKYLILYKKLNIPGIGSFAIEQIPARLDFLNKQLHSPLPVIRFNLGNAVADKHFYDFLAKEKGLQEWEAIRQFNDLTFEIKNTVNSKGMVELPGIGTLKKEFTDTYSFQPAGSLQPYFPDVAAERIIRKNATHSVKVGDAEKSSTEMQELLAPEKPKKSQWVKYAIILAVLGAAAIAYYYATKPAN
jgi:nucleoid DNA-binding protein